MVTLNDKKFAPYISEAELNQIVSALAVKINKDYKGKKPLLLGVLNGSFMFISDLMKKLTIDCELSFIKLSSYSGTKSQGVVDEVIGLSTSLENRDVIVLEDIIDTGNTVGKLFEILKKEETKSLAIGTLLLKPDVFKERFSVDYIGKEIPDAFVVGYGLDYDQLGRNLKEIYQLSE
ncbi:MAG: hypoxanthine phosphoribosyltransferase [Arenicella sp.]